MNTSLIRGLALLFFAAHLGGGLSAHTLAKIGSAAPSPGANDIAQLATSGTVLPDKLNYSTSNDPIAGQTFTTGPNATRLVSVSIKTAGRKSGEGYGSPASTPTYFLRLYSINGGAATPLITFSSPNPGFIDGEWLQWSGLNVPLEANKTFAFSFGIKPGNGGEAALAVAANAYSGGEIAMIPVNGGPITTGGSHSFDATFVLGLRPARAFPDSTPLPIPTYGWNLGNTLESTWGFPSPTAAPFYAAGNAGFNAVRIPCAWGFNSDKTTYQINPAYMAQVKQAVDWAIAAGMYVVINNHWDGGWMENNIGTTVDPVINERMKAYWTQIATAFAGYDNHLLFAAANEPNVHSFAAMNTLMAYYQTFINAVRGVGGKNANRWLVLQGGGDTAWLKSLPADSTPNRLMLEYHCYTPFQFTQLGSDASWGKMQYYWGKAYHYAADADHNATAEEGVIDSGFQQLTDQYVSKGIPVLVGEFQAAGKRFLKGTEATYNQASAIYWNKYLVDSAHGHGLSPFYWSTPNSPFEYATGKINGEDVVSVLTGGIAPPPPNGAPFAASRLTATPGMGQISLSWAPGKGATSYNLYRAAGSGYESSIAPVVTGITGTSYIDTNLNGGTTYYYQVVAVNKAGQSGFSAEAHAKTPGVNPDPAQYHFETDTQRWEASGGQIAAIATSTIQRYAGNRSLAMKFNGTAAGSSSVQLSDVAVPPGATVTFRVWVPKGHPFKSIEPYAQDYNWASTSGWHANLTPDAWNTVTLTVPSGAVTPMKRLGLRFATNAPWSGICYVDSVTWPVTELPGPPTGLKAVPRNGGVALSWNASDTATNYVVKRSTTAGSGYTTIGTTSSPSYVDSNVVNGTTYYYVVSASNATGEGVASARASNLQPTSPGR